MAFLTDLIEKGRQSNTDAWATLSYSTDLFFFTRREGTDPNTTDVDLVDLQDIPLAMPNRKVNVRRNLETAMIKLNGQLNIRYE